MSSTEARWVTASASAAASTSGNSSSSAGGTKSRLGRPPASPPQFLALVAVAHQHHPQFGVEPRRLHQHLQALLEAHVAGVQEHGLARAPAQPAPHLVHAGFAGRATCDQFGTRRIRSCAARPSPPPWPRTLVDDADECGAAQDAGLDARRSRAARSPPRMPLCAAAAPIRSCTTGTNGTPWRRASRAASTPPARLGIGRPPRGAAPSGRCERRRARASDSSYSARRTAVCRDGTVCRLRCTRTPPRSSVVAPHAPVAGVERQAG